MHASDLQIPLPLVDRETTALAAAKMIAHDRLAGLVVADKHGKPVAVVSAVDVLGLLVPAYILDDMSLAGVFDESSADDIWGGSNTRVIGELLDDSGVTIRDILVIDADASLVEIAAQMVDAHSQIALVRGGDGDTPGFLALPLIMDAILTFCGPATGEGSANGSAQ